MGLLSDDGGEGGDVVLFFFRGEKGEGNLNLYVRKDGTVDRFSGACEKGREERKPRPRKLETNVREQGEQRGPLLSHMWKRRKKKEKGRFKKPILQAKQKRGKKWGTSFQAFYILYQSQVWKPIRGKGGRNITFSRVR